MLQRGIREKNYIIVQHRYGITINTLIYVLLNASVEYRSVTMRNLGKAVETNERWFAINRRYKSNIRSCYWAIKGGRELSCTSSDLLIFSSKKRLASADSKTNHAVGPSRGRWSSTFNEGKIRFICRERESEERC